MSIDRRLYQKYTGKLPGEAMTRYGEALAKDAASRSKSSSSGGSPFLRGLSMGFKIRIVASLIASLAVLGTILLGLI